MLLSLSMKSAVVRCQLFSVLILFAFTASNAAFTWAQTPTDLVGGQFAPNCGNATAVPIFDSALLGGGVYGVNNLIAISDPDIVLIGNQWWMIFAGGPAYPRALAPMAAYLPPGASLATSTTYPSDPNGWHIVGAQADGQGTAYPLSSTASSWDAVAAETPSADVGSDGLATVYYAGHNAGQTNFEIGVMTSFANGLATGHSNPVMVAEEPWEFSSGLGAVLEQSVRWMPQLNKYIMYYTAGAWWASPPDNTLAYAESTDGVNWVNRQSLQSPVSYYNQDFLYNPTRNRYEMVISNDPTGAGGANPRNLVWREAATPATNFSDWGNEVTLLQYNASNGAGWYNSGALSPAVKYGNLPGEENRMFVFFHSYTQSGDMVFGRFYCDAGKFGSFTLSLASPTINLLPSNGTTDALTVIGADSFSGTVGFTTSTLPAGVNVAFSPATTNSSTQFVVYVQPGTAPGSYPITITGTSGPLTASVPVTVNVQQAQTINFGAIATQTAATQLVLTATASSGLPVTYSAIPASVCSVAGSTASLVGAGSCTIMAMQPGNATYAAATPQSQTFTVNQALLSQTITFNPISAQPAGSSLTPTASASSGLPVTFSVVPNGNCSISGNTVTFLNVGNCEIVANQSGSASYAAASAVNQVVVVTVGNPTIMFTVPNTHTIDSPIHLAASSNSTGGFAYSVVSGPATVSGSTLTLTGGGVVEVLANQSASSNFNSGVATATFTSIAGSVWLGNSNNSLSAFDLSGNVLSPTNGFIGGGVSGVAAPQGMAFDGSGDLWVANANGVSKFSGSGAAITSTANTSGGINDPLALAVDGLGQVWIANGNGTVSALSNSASAVTPATGYSGAGLSTPGGIAVDLSGNLWVTNSSDNSVTEVLGVAAPSAPLSTALTNGPTGGRP